MHYMLFTYKPNINNIRSVLNVYPALSSIKSNQKILIVQNIKSVDYTTF